MPSMTIYTEGLGRKGGGDCQGRTQGTHVMALCHMTVKDTLNTYVSNQHGDS